MMTYDEAAECRDIVSDATISAQLRKHGLPDDVADAKAEWLAETGRPLRTVSDLCAYLGY